MRWATTDGSGIVIRIDDEFPGDGIFVLQIQDGTPCELGWKAELGFFYPPKWTSYEFLINLTKEERATIRQLSQTDENVADFLMLAQSAQEIISTDPTTLAGMNYMVYIGVFSEQRKNDILATAHF